MPARTYSEWALYRRLLAQARPCWPHIAGLFALGLLSAPLALLVPLPLKIAVDNVIGHQPLPAFMVGLVPTTWQNSPVGLLWFAAVLLIGIALLRQLSEMATAVLRAYTGERLVLGLRGQLFRHVQRLSLGYHDTRGTADSVYRIQYDAPSIQSITIDGLVPLFAALITLLSMIAVTWRINAQLALVAMGVAPVVFLLSHYYRVRMRRRSHEIKHIESSALSVVQETLGSIRVVKAFVQEEREQERFLRESGRGMGARLNLAIMEGGFGLNVGLTTAVGAAAVLFLGIHQVQTARITLGDLLLVMGYLAQIYEPLKTMSKKAMTLQSGLASAERAFSLLDSTPDVHERRPARPIARARGRIEFRGVSFAYGTEPAVLQKVSFEVAPGERVGIAGATGAGKTTLVSLLTRFYDPTAGAILLDGVDLREYKLADLRQQFGIVLQEPVLLSTSVAENIAYARPGATPAEIVSAAKAASAHEFIDRLPQGYDTLVGERGMRLSGGERQRISLARAFLRDAPILILDEPTSSVDLGTEAEILRALDDLMRGRTTLMIAHRLDTLAHCDSRIELVDGRVVKYDQTAEAHGA